MTATQAPLCTDTHAATGYRLLSVIVPLRNQRNDVCEVLRRMRAVPLPVDREIIVVDDASDDGTDKVLAALEDSTIRVVGHRARLGRSAAIRTGLAAARGDLVLFQDPDLRYDPRDWPALLAPVLAGRTKVVYGSRYIGPQEAVSVRQWASEHLVGLLASVLFNRTLSDLGASKLVDRRVLDEVGFAPDAAPAPMTPRFEFNPYVTARVLRAGHRIYEVPVAYADRRRDDRGSPLRRDRLAKGWSLIRLRFGRNPVGGRLDRVVDTESAAF